jgi:hypothetical protein
MPEQVVERHGRATQDAGSGSTIELGDDLLGCGPAIGLARRSLDDASVRESSLSMSSDPDDARSGALRETDRARVELGLAALRLRRHERSSSMLVVEYQEGEHFPGVIGRTTDESSRAWARPSACQERRAERALRRPGRHGLWPVGLLRQPDRHPDLRPARIVWLAQDAVGAELAVTGRSLPAVGGSHAA